MPATRAISHDDSMVILSGKRAANDRREEGDLTPSQISRSKKCARRASTKDAPRNGSVITDEAVQVDESRTVLKDGKLVSSKDGRAAAGGNDLKTRFPNNNRNHTNDNLFYGKALKLGEEHALFSTRMTSAYLLTSLAIIR